MGILQINQSIKTPIISVSSMLFIKSVPTVKDFLSSGEKVSRDKSVSAALFFQFITLLIIILFASTEMNAQRKSDIGLFGGTSFYMGDINTSKYFYSPGPAIGSFYRYNFEPRNSIRLSAVYYTLQASDLDFSDPFQVQRNASFSGNYLDAALVYEFNFLPYKTTHRKYNRTFYLSGGIGYNVVISTSTLSKSYVTVPVGMGYKVNVTKKLAAGAELSIRKTFNDLIDGIENFNAEGRKHLFGNNDWYTFAGIFVSYKIFNYREDCPAYY